MTYIGNQPLKNFVSFDSQSLTGNGTTGPYTLTAAVSNVNEIEVFVNFVRQRPGVAYTVAGNQLTMTGAVASTDDFYVVFQGKSVGTVRPPDGSITQAKLAPGLVLGGGSFKGDSGGGTADIIRVHEKQLDTNVTIDANTNGLCAGPLTVATGVTVTVSSGSTLVVA